MARLRVPDGNPDVALAWLGRKIAAEFLRHRAEQLSIGRRLTTIGGYVRPQLRISRVQLKPWFGARIGIMHDRIYRAFSNAASAITAVHRVDHEHVFALVKGIMRTHLDTHHVFALDTCVRDDARHSDLPRHRCTPRSFAPPQRWAFSITPKPSSIAANRDLRSCGFSRKSSAPSFIASTASPML